MISKGKAKKILHDGEVKGNPLTDKQRGFMGARASGAKMKSKKKRRRVFYPSNQLFK